MALAEVEQTNNASHFSDDQKRFSGNPAMPGRLEFARKYSFQTHEVNAVWKTLPKEDQTREILLAHYQTRFKDIMNPGHYEFSARPLEFVPENGQAWVVADALLGDKFRGESEQPFVLNVRTHSMRLISEWGQRAIDLNLIPGEDPVIRVYDTANFHRDDAKHANEIITKAGPLFASEVFMNIVDSLPLPRPVTV